MAMDGGNGDERGADGRFVPGHKKLPGAGTVAGQKYADPYAILQRGMVRICGMTLEVVDDEKIMREASEKLKASFRANPAGFIVRVIIPLSRILPEKLRIEFFAHMDTDNKEAADVLDSARLLIEAAEAKEVDLDELSARLRHGASGD